MPRKSRLLVGDWEEFDLLLRITRTDRAAPEVGISDPALFRTVGDYQIKAWRRSYLSHYISAAYTTPPGFFMKPRMEHCTDYFYELHLMREGALSEIVADGGSSKSDGRNSETTFWYYGIGNEGLPKDSRTLPDKGGELALLLSWASSEAEIELREHYIALWESLGIQVPHLYIDFQVWRQLNQSRLVAFVS